MFYGQLPFMKEKVLDERANQKERCRKNRDPRCEIHQDLFFRALRQGRSRISSLLLEKHSWQDLGRS